MLELFPDADIFTLFLEKDSISDKIKKHRIFTSSLNKYGFIRKRYKHFLPLFPAAIEDFDLKEYDIIISISHCVAKGIIPHPGSLHISYVNSPMRYIWDRYSAYFGKTGGLKKFFIKQQVSKLRTWDVAGSARVDRFIGNSSFIRERIHRYYRREADVIHPPVDIGGYGPVSHPTRDYFLTVSALVPYKQVDLLVDAFNRGSDRLIIVGKGGDEKKLKRMANKNIEFKKDLSQTELKDLYANAAAYVFAGVEDFGIVFVEAQACGTPVLAYNRGGVMDIVTEGTGVLFDKQSPEAILEGVEKIKKNAFDPSFIRENSLKFSREAFKAAFKDYCDKAIEETLNIDDK